MTKAAVVMLGKLFGQCSPPVGGLGAYRGARWPVPLMTAGITEVRVRRTLLGTAERYGPGPAPLYLTMTAAFSR